MSSVSEPLPCAGQGSGYLHRLYAESLSEFGTPRFLPAARGWILQRRVPFIERDDAMGPYPLFLCEDWSRLHVDLTELGEELISLVAVIDPFADCDPQELRRDFDLVVPFKEHYVVDLQEPLKSVVKKRHLQYALRALRDVEVECCTAPSAHLDEWVELYAGLCRRHSLSGIRAFSRLAFEKQLCVPGLVMFRAACAGSTLGLDLWYVSGDVAYLHLAAMSDAGYERRVSYALKWWILNYFQGRIRWLNLGGRAGWGGERTGLDHFKRGWSTRTVVAYLCGRIFDHEAYARATTLAGSEGAAYFPAYRQNEFAGGTR